MSRKETAEKHHCLDCGALISSRSKRCVKCAPKDVWKDSPRLRQKKHPCIDCGVPCDYRVIRCRSCSHIKRHKEFPPPRGANNPLWKGGIKRTGGYIYLYKPEYHRSNIKGWVAEHIYIWEQVNNKPLPKGWVIHHLNGIKDDNRPVNLVALPNMKHVLVLQAKAKRIQELEAMLNGQHQLL